MEDALEGTLLPASTQADMEGEYRQVRWIGGGSFGRVFLVLHVREGRHYVMKEVAAFADLEEKQQQATRLEVQLLRETQHPNIVGYRDSYVNQGGNLCIFMEYCEQGDVHSFLQRLRESGRPLPPETQALEWLVQITLALHALHVRRILHRDLKTQNVFLTGSGPVAQRHNSEGASSSAFAIKLGDLGIARVLDSTTELAATQIGTPLNMSPEVFNSKPYSYQSDVWGLGCVFYELINGQHAFEAQSINGLALKILRGRYTPITVACSDDAKRLIKWMLNTSPSKRPSLQAVLQSTAARKQIPAAAKAAVHAAGSLEARAKAEEVLLSQLASLGLSGAWAGAGAAAALLQQQRQQPPQQEPQQEAQALQQQLQQKARDRRQAQLQQRLERAERRKKREEETLRRLQETAQVLRAYLREARQPGAEGVPAAPAGYGGHAVEPPVGGAGAGGYCHPPSTSSYAGCNGGYAGPAAQVHRRVGRAATQLPAPPLAPLAHHTPTPSQGALPLVSARSGQELDDIVHVMTHRDRVLLRKEQRQQEEQQRFEEEARKIREENLAYQRAWVQGCSSKEQFHNPSGGSAVSRHQQAPRHSHGLQGPRSPLLGPAQPPPPAVTEGQGQFRSRAAAARTPRRRLPSGDSLGVPEGHHHGARARVDSGGPGPGPGPAGPCPPRARYGEPVPPSHGPRQRWTYWGGGANGGEVHSAMVTSRSLRSVCLESLADPLHSEDSEISCASLSEGSEGGQLVSVDRGASFPGARDGVDELLWKQSQGVQRRIARCRASIGKHRATIDALQAQIATFGVASADRFGAPPDTTPSEASYWPDDGCRMQPAASTQRTHASAVAPSVPALVQDRVARLRRRCLEGLGSDKFQAARNCLQALLGAEEVAGAVRERMLEMLGLDKIGYYSLIDQIVHMEQTWGTGDCRRTRGGSDTGSDATGWRSGAEQWPGGPGAFRRATSPSWSVHFPLVH